MVGGCDGVLGNEWSGGEGAAEHGVARVEFVEMGCRLSSGAKRRMRSDAIVSSAQGECAVAVKEYKFSNVYITKDAVETWWPNGLGGQTLYEINVFWEGVVPAETGSSTKTVRIGFRTIELVEEPASKSILIKIYIINVLNIFPISNAIRRQQWPDLLH